MDDLRANSPWVIPADADVERQHKDGYDQVKYSWSTDGWRYTVRYHTQLPTATLITYPSWQMTRVHPGKGFGADHAARVDQTRLLGKWVPTRMVRYAALQYQKGQATAQQINMLKQSHRQGKH